jgi:hypothetical protein
MSEQIISCSFAVQVPDQASKRVHWAKANSRAVAPQHRNSPADFFPRESSKPPICLKTYRWMLNDTGWLNLFKENVFFLTKNQTRDKSTDES